jgi:hypothetical protein
VDEPLVERQDAAEGCDRVRRELLLEACDEPQVIADDLQHP